MEQDTRRLLGLQGYRVLAISQDAEQDVVTAEPPLQGVCPHCGEATARVHQRSARPSRILWRLLGDRPVWLLVRRQRLWCARCRRAFSAPLPGVAPRQRASVAVQVAALAALKERSFASLGRSWGIGYGRARRLLERLPLPWCDWDALVGQAGPVHLGIDEHSFRGTELVITLTCLSTRRLLAILPDDRQATLRQALRSLPPALRHRIDGVCIDLKAGFKTVVHQQLPAARVVADRFHVIHDANKRLDAARRLEQAEAKTPLKRWPLLKGQERLTARQQGQLADLQARYPTLKEHHWIKEQLRALYGEADLAAAERRWHSLLVVMEASEDAAIWQWARTLRAWRKEILGFFHQRLSNGFTEGCHTKIKLLKRLSYGFRNVNVYSRKMLLGFLPTSPATLTPHFSS
jgi:transposase